MKYLFLALLFFVPFSADAALQAMTGMETGGTNEFIATSGTFSVQSSLARSGAFALRTNPATTGTGFITFADVDATFRPAVLNPLPNQLWATFYFRYATGPVTGDEPISRATDNNGRNICGITLNDDGKVIMRRTAASGALGSSVATSTTALAPDTWYRLEYTCFKSGAGDYEVRIDGTTEMSGTADFDDGTNGWRNIAWGKSVNLNGNTVDFYYDDIWVDDTSFVGAHAIKVLVPNAPGTDNNFNDTNGNPCWTNICYLGVDETPVSSTRYVVSTTTGTQQTFHVQNPEIMDITGTINAVSIFERAIEQAAGTSEWQFLAYTSAASTTATQELSAGAERIWNLPTEPVADAPWTLSTLANLEIGCREGSGSGVRVRCQEMIAMVSYTEDSSYSETPEIRTVQGTLCNTLGCTSDFTYSGFGEMDAAMIILNNANTTSNPQDNSVQGIGFWDGVNLRAVSAGETDANSTTISFRSSDDSYFAISSADATHGAAYTVATTTDGIRLTLAFDNTTVDRYATVILFKGVQAHVFHMFPNGTHNASATSTSLGFEPDLVFMTSIGNTTIDAVGIGVSLLSYGFVADDLTQGATIQFSQDGSAVADQTQYVSKLRSAGQTSTGGSVTWATEIINMNTDTFTAITRSGASGGDIMFGLALGGALSYDAGFIDTPIVTGTQVTATDVTPGTVLTALGTADGFDSAVSTSSANSLSFGIADSTGNQSAYNYTGQDGGDPTNNFSSASTTALIQLDSSVASARTNVVNGTVSMDSDSFDINYTVVDTVSKKGWWVAFAGAANTTPGDGAFQIQDDGSFEIQNDGLFIIE